MNFPLIYTNLFYKQVFENPTLSRSTLRRSVVNSAHCLLQLPLTVPDAVRHTYIAKEQCVSRFKLYAAAYRQRRKMNVNKIHIK
jgi:uncharacterized protein (DUF2384 family)